jgi:hypothetical protein
LLCPDKCTVPERIEFIFEKKKGEERERKRGQFLPEEVEERVGNSSRKLGIRRV